MSIETARKVLAVQTEFDYLAGRVMKIDLSDNDEVDVRFYNRDNGDNAAQDVKLVHYHARTYYVRGKAKQKLDQHVEAIKDFKKMQELIPYNPMSDIALAISSTHLQKEKDAIRYYQKALDHKEELSEQDLAETEESLRLLKFEIVDSVSIIKQLSAAEENAYQQYTCPISHELMREPTRATCEGQPDVQHAYEKAIIQTLI